jgi:hypothetical protein
VEKFLRMFTNQQQDNWFNWLPLAEFAYNNVVNEVMGYTPFFLNKGRHPRTLPSDSVVDPDMLVEVYLEAIKAAARKGEALLAWAKETMKRRWDKGKTRAKDYCPGELVLILADRLPSNRPSRKLDDKWRGPFKVLSKKGLVAYKLELPA